VDEEGGEDDNGVVVDDVGDPALEVLLLAVLSF
jgi:hypothetical protein